MEKQPSMDEQFLKITSQIIENNIDKENFSVEDLAQKVGLSRSMLHRKLIKLTGKSASDLITEKRLIKAKELLENDVATTSEIAYKVGFSDPSYFNKVFKKYYKVSPGDVRKKGAPDLVDSLKSPQPRILGLPKSKASQIILKAAIILLILIIAGGGIYYLINTKKTSEMSLAVLPIHNLTGQPENAYFVDGMHDALIGELGQIKSLRVISRTSTLRYRNSEMLLKDIASELGVNIIVEGSVFCSGDSLCFMIQLIDVFPKERHILANEYRDGIQNVLTVQSAAVKDIAQNIRIKLSKDEEQRITKTRKVDPETYKDYLRGLYYFNQGTFESFETGISYMQKAIKRDPGEPLAHAGLALGYALMGHGYIESPEAFRTAEAAANKALKIDPTLDEAFMALAMLNLYNFWNWPKAQEAFENALARNPNNEIAHAHYAWYHVLFNDKEKSLYHARMATILEPLSPSYYSWLGWLCVYFKEFEQAEIAARKTLELMENHPYGNIVLGYVYLNKKQYQKAIETHKKLPLNFSILKVVLAYTYVQAGEIDKAIALRNEVEEESKHHWVNPFDRGLLAGMLGYKDQAFELLNEACEHHYYPTNHINVFLPNAEFLKGDPRYSELFQKMNLPYKETILASKSTKNQDISD
jgi:AraC-like DNA-binding protein/TolB-like protein/Tfp pilus assembly protein PilF